MPQGSPRPPAFAPSSDHFIITEVKHVLKMAMGLCQTTQEPSQSSKGQSWGIWKRKRIIQYWIITLNANEYP